MASPFRGIAMWNPSVLKPGHAICSRNLYETDFDSLLGPCRDKVSNCESSNGHTIRTNYHGLDSVSFNKS